MKGDLTDVRGTALSDRLARTDLSAIDLAGLAGLISSEAVRLLSATRAAVWVYRPSMHKLVLPGDAGSLVVPLLDGQRLPTEPLVWAAGSDGVLNQLITETFGAASGTDGGHVVALPLLVSERPHGLLLLEFASGDAEVTPEAVSLAVQAAAAVANLKALSAALRHERELQALNETAGELSSKLDTEIVLQAIVDRARSLIGSDVAYITLFDENTESIYMRVTSGVRRASFGSIRLSLGEGLGGLVAKEWRAIYTSDYLNDARFRHRPEVDDEVREEGIKSILGVPMRVGGRTIGVLYVANRRVTPFTDADVSLLSSLAGHAAITIENARLFEELSQSATRMNEANELIQHQLRRLERSEAVHRQLTELVLGGEGLEAFARVLGELIDKPVTVIDANLRLLAAAGGPGDPFEEKIRRARGIPADCLEDRYFAGAFTEGTRLRPLRVRPGLSRGSRVRLLTPVVARAEVLGYLLVPLSDDEGTEEVEVVLEQGARVAALEMLKERSVAEIEDRTRGEFLDDLLADRPPPPEVLRKRGSQVGLDLDRGYRVVLLQVDEQERGEPRPPVLGRRARQSLAAALRRAPEASFVAERRDAVVAFVPERPDGTDSALDAAALAGRVRKRIESEEPGAVVTGVVTGPCRSADEYGREIQLAWKALRLLAELGRHGTIVPLDKLGLLPLLLEERRRPEIEQSVERILGPLLRYDREHDTSLVDTLEAFFLSLGNVAQTAERCHVHINSVYYRLDRIRDVLGRDFGQPEAALDLQVALRARRLLLGSD